MKRKWPTIPELIAALKSGKYKKAKERLIRTEEGEVSYCCLGVCAKLAGYEDEELMSYSSLFWEDGSPLCDGPDWLTNNDEEAGLIYLNDDYEGWDKVIEELKSLQKVRNSYGS